MLCQECKQNQASVPFIQIIDGEKKVYHLCAECAEKKSGLGGSLTVTLSGILAQDEGQEDAKVPDLTCASCGLTYAEFRKTGRFGCAACYTAFDAELAEVLRRIHGSSRHAGQPPESSGAEDCSQQVSELSRALQEAVAAERFEDAARLRDQIAILKAQSGPRAKAE